MRCSCAALLWLACIASAIWVVQADTSAECALADTTQRASACEWVKTKCSNGGVMPYLSWYYCSLRDTSPTVRRLVQAALFALLILVFRVLGSTASYFFSPTLSQLSEELGLPPRLAGVTLLALGNGAPDLSSAISATRVGTYQLAIGASTGAGTFVTCIVAGAVLLVRQAPMVTSFGFYRDIFMYVTTVSSVLGVYKGGKVDRRAVAAWLCLYGLYVLVVVMADLVGRARKYWTVRRNRRVVDVMSSRTAKDHDAKLKLSPALKSGSLGCFAVDSFSIPAAREPESVSSAVHIQPAAAIAELSVAKPAVAESQAELLANEMPTVYDTAASHAEPSSAPSGLSKSSTSAGAMKRHQQPQDAMVVDNDIDVTVPGVVLLMQNDMYNSASSVGSMIIALDSAKHQEPAEGAAAAQHSRAGTPAVSVSANDTDGTTSHVCSTLPPHSQVGGQVLQLGDAVPQRPQGLVVGAVSHTCVPNNGDQHALSSTGISTEVAAVAHEASGSQGAVNVNAAARNKPGLTGVLPQASSELGDATVWPHETSMDTRARHPVGTEAVSASEATMEKHEAQQPAASGGLATDLGQADADRSCSHQRRASSIVTSVRRASEAVTTAVLWLAKQPDSDPRSHAGSVKSAASDDAATAASTPERGDGVLQPSAKEQHQTDGGHRPSADGLRGRRNDQQRPHVVPKGSVPVPGARGITVPDTVDALIDRHKASDASQTSVAQLQLDMKRVAWADRLPLPWLSTRVWPVFRRFLHALNTMYWWLELPLTVARKMTIPLAYHEVYDRRWLVASLLVAPFLAAYEADRWYLWVVTMVLDGVQTSMGYLVAAAVTGCITSCAAYIASGRWPGPPQWKLGTPVPIGAAVLAVYGFLMAGVWIRAISAELVALLQFFGVVYGVDDAILGITLLAWGNSIGDLVTNVAMARKGLQEMAFTAAFAAPTFNLLLGQGIGFVLYLNESDQQQQRVSLEDVVLTGMVAVLCNSALLVLVSIVCRGRVPRRHGFVMWTVYMLYMAAAAAFAVKSRAQRATAAATPA